MQDILFRRKNLYIIFDIDLLLDAGKDIEGLCGALCSAGVDVLQARFSAAISDKKACSILDRISVITREAGTCFFVNNRPDIAIACKANLHIGQDDMPVGTARLVVGADKIIGLSCHSDAEIQAAQPLACDYFSIGPIFPTLTKPDYKVVGIELAERWYNRVEKPFVLIGGINLGNLEKVLRFDPWAVAVCRDILLDKDPAAKALRYLDVLRR